MEATTKEQDLYATNKALYAIWDARSFASIKDDRDYFESFTEDSDIIAYMNSGSAVVWSPGIDGVFKIIVRMGEKLSSQEQDLLHKSSLNHKFITSDKEVFLGSPEWVGYKEQEGLNKGVIAKLDLEVGTYQCDIHCLLRKTEFVAYLDYIVLLKKVTDNHKFTNVDKLPYLDISKTPQTVEEEIS